MAPDVVKPLVQRHQTRRRRHINIEPIKMRVGACGITVITLPIALAPKDARTLHLLDKQTETCLAPPYATMQPAIVSASTSLHTALRWMPPGRRL
ncbi:hypothetical protein SDRG_12484 [Saprolegnia diclina VS20]|uniref:Uncharacterized protein n=1 Tax=Saprolegnia diclina (strain VS20) TaxID=1156394 RepID=T0RIM8_SAPDV|nr:hypothetical protein SDRG_12484 [Saprolegnia diclina VS20]EQC29712.1 hypothetical protein SDRG_12484 [Saprolegnia diclina VS20]|eukprot:XP_008616778.1 hypothetical protein SDRG_12484 [Saprolegnia diclina VS20]